MSKKISFSIVVVLIVAMLTSSLALAAEMPASAFSRPGSRFGMVASISDNSFTLKNGGGKENTVLVSSTTRFIKINGDPKTFKNLGVDQGALAFGTIDENKDLDAKVVVLAPRRFNRGDWSGPRQYGRVISVDTAKESLLVYTPNGFMTFTVDEDTHFPGSVNGLGAVKAGMTVFLGYKQGKSSKLMLKALIAIP